MLISDVKIGMKVHRVIPFIGLCQNGIVKSYGGKDDTVYVVYCCDDEWENYRDHAAALTYLRNLRPGWEEA